MQIYYNTIFCLNKHTFNISEPKKFKLLDLAMELHDLACDETSTF